MCNIIAVCAGLLVHFVLWCNILLCRVNCYMKDKSDDYQNCFCCIVHLVYFI